MACKLEIKLNNGTILKGWNWHSDHPKVNLVFIPGMAEYAYRFAPMMEYFTKNGIEVFSIDILGQGLNVSDPKDYECWPKDGFRMHVEAIHKLILLAKENGLPTVLMGHSMGSLLAQGRMEKYPLDVSKTILVGTNGGQRISMKMGYIFFKAFTNKRNWNKPAHKLQALGVNAFSKRIKNRRKKYDWISYNEENVDSFMADPQCAHDMTWGFLREFVKGLAKIWDKKEMKKISKDEKIYITSGEDDGHGRYGKGPKWLIKEYKKLGVREVRYKFYPNMRHEIHNEIGKEEVYLDLLNEILSY